MRIIDLYLEGFMPSFVEDRGNRAGFGYWEHPTAFLSTLNLTPSIEITLQGKTKPLIRWYLEDYYEEFRFNELGNVNISTLKTINQYLLKSENKSSNFAKIIGLMLDLRSNDIGDYQVDSFVTKAIEVDSLDSAQAFVTKMQKEMVNSENSEDELGEIIYAIEFPITDSYTSTILKLSSELNRGGASTTVSHIIRNTDDISELITSITYFIDNNIVGDDLSLVIQAVLTNRRRSLSPGFNDEVVLLYSTLTQAGLGDRSAPLLNMAIRSRRSLTELSTAVSLFKSNGIETNEIDEIFQAFMANTNRPLSVELINTIITLRSAISGAGVNTGSLLYTAITSNLLLTALPTVVSTLEENGIRGDELTNIIRVIIQNDSVSSSPESIDDIVALRNALRQVNVPEPIQLLSNIIAATDRPLSELTQYINFLSSKNIDGNQLRPLLDAINDPGIVLQPVYDTLGEQQSITPTEVINVLHGGALINPAIEYRAIIPRSNNPNTAQLTIGFDNSVGAHWTLVESVNGDPSDYFAIVKQGTFISYDYVNNTGPESNAIRQQEALYVAQALRASGIPLDWTFGFRDFDTERSMPLGDVAEETIQSIVEPYSLITLGSEGDNLDFISFLPRATQGEIIVEIRRDGITIDYIAENDGDPLKLKRTAQLLLLRGSGVDTQVLVKNITENQGTSYTLGELAGIGEEFFFGVGDVFSFSDNGQTQEFVIQIIDSDILAVGNLNTGQKITMSKSEWVNDMKTESIVFKRPAEKIESLQLFTNEEGAENIIEELSKDEFSITAIMASDGKLYWSNDGGAHSAIQRASALTNPERAIDILEITDNTLLLILPGANLPGRERQILTTNEEVQILETFVTLFSNLPNDVLSEVSFQTVLFSAEQEFQGTLNELSVWLETQKQEVAAQNEPDLISGSIIPFLNANMFQRWSEKYIYSKYPEAADKGATPRMLIEGIINWITPNNVTSEQAPTKPRGIINQIRSTLFNTLIGEIKPIHVDEDTDVLVDYFNFNWSDFTPINKDTEGLTETQAKMIDRLREKGIPVFKGPPGDSYKINTFAHGDKIGNIGAVAGLPFGGAVAISPELFETPTHNGKPFEALFIFTVLHEEAHIIDPIQQGTETTQLLKAKREVDANEYAINVMKEELGYSYDSAYVLSALSYSQKDQQLYQDLLSGSKPDTLVESEKLNKLAKNPVKLFLYGVGLGKLFNLDLPLSSKDYQYRKYEEVLERFIHDWIPLIKDGTKTRKEVAEIIVDEFSKELIAYGAYNEIEPELEKKIRNSVNKRLRQELGIVNQIVDGVNSITTKTRVLLLDSISSLLFFQDESTSISVLDIATVKLRHATPEERADYSFYKYLAADLHASLSEIEPGSPQFTNTWSFIRSIREIAKPIGLELKLTENQIAQDFMGPASGMILTKPEMIFICHYGQERSRAAADAYKDIGAKAGHFTGGTRNLNRLTEDEIRKQISPGSQVYLIYDQGSPQNEYEEKEKAVRKLKEMGIDYTILETSGLRTILFDQGVDLFDYLY
ncbi:hypothetical protein ACFL0F_00850 [Patescibacteria group bacterium]